jgi:hypothetical protein
MRRTTALTSSLFGLVVPLLLAAAPAAPAAAEPATTQPGLRSSPYQLPPNVAAAAASTGYVKPELALKTKVPEIKFDGIPLGDAMDFIRDISDTNIHVNWRALELLNVTRQMPVSVRMGNVPLKRVLRSILDDTGLGDAITFYAEDGVLEVTTREIADSKLITKVYPVEDLVVEVPNFAGPTFNLQNQSNTASGGGGGGSSGGTLFSGAGDATAGGLTGATKQQRGEDLVRLVQDTVRPDVWRENGGTAAVRYFNGHLIVTAPRSVHERLVVGK